MKPTYPIPQEITSSFFYLVYKYDLPVGDDCYYYLYDRFQRIRQGEPNKVDSTASYCQRLLDTARMLKQLSFFREGRGFSLIVGVTQQEYSSPQLVEGMTHTLTEALSRMVTKGSSHLIFNVVTYAELADYPEPDGSTKGIEGFSDNELDTIIAKALELQGWARKMQGNKGKESEIKTKSNELGQWVTHLKECVPSEWTKYKQYSFIGDFMVRAGLLKFRGDEWSENWGRYMTQKEKVSQVRLWENCHKRNTGKY